MYWAQPYRDILANLHKRLVVENFTRTKGHVFYEKDFSTQRYTLVHSWSVMLLLLTELSGWSLTNAGGQKNTVPPKKRAASEVHPHLQLTLAGSKCPSLKCVWRCSLDLPQTLTSSSMKTHLWHRASRFLGIVLRLPPIAVGVAMPHVAALLPFCPVLAGGASIPAKAPPPGLLVEA